MINSFPSEANPLLSLSRDALDRQQAIKDRCFHPSQTFVEFKKTEIEQSITARFEQQVQRYPDRTAVKLGDRDLSYTALNKIANQIGRAILSRSELGVEPVTLLLGHDIWMSAAIFGVLKAGKIFVALDPHYPLSRTSYILNDSQAGLIVTNTKYLPLARQLAGKGCQLINLDQDLADFSDEDLDLPIPPDNLAYIVYTSGSTGQPKGIVHTHRNLLHNIMIYTNAFHFCCYDRLTLLHPCSFSSGLMDTFCALLNGAGLYLWDFKTEGLAGLADWLTQEEISFLSWVPTPFRHLGATIAGGQTFPRLRLVALGSEPVLEQDVNLYRKHFGPDCLFANRFGATEVNIVCLYFVDKETRLNGHIVPAGFTVEDKELLLFDEAGLPVDVGQVGEIAIRSRYLSPGYWNKPELTQKAFKANDGSNPDKLYSSRIYMTGDLGRIRSDGCFEYFGRKDFQVKIRGHRIEVSEIEMALHKTGLIKEAVVAADRDGAGEMRLVAYLVAQPEGVPSADILYDALKEKVPEYMLPAGFMIIDSLPLNPNGKLDRRALPPYDPALALTTTFVAPRTPTEKTLADIWAGVLKVNQVGSRDNFFALGGNSLLATQVLSRLQNILKVSLPLRSFFEAPTIAELSQVIDQHKNSMAEVKQPAITPLSRQSYRVKRS